jgi:hypothetical protein
MGAALSRRARVEPVAALARHHVRLGCLELEMRLGRRAVYRSLCPREPVQAAMTVLSVADRLATRDGPPNVTLAGAGRPVKAGRGVRR